MKPIVAPLLCFVLAFAGLTATFSVAQHHAYAQGSAAGSGSSAATPADGLRDPLLDPIGAIDDVKAARRVGWAAVLGAVLTMLSLAVGTLGRTVKALAWLRSGSWAIAVGLVGALGAGAYNAATQGGSWMAVVFAAMIGAAAWWNARGAAS